MKNPVKERKTYSLSKLFRATGRALWRGSLIDHGYPDAAYLTDDDMRAIMDRLQDVIFTNDELIQKIVKEYVAEVYPEGPISSGG